MRIRFEQEGTTWFAISQDVEFEGYLYQELIWAEIDQALGGVMIRFESDYNNPIHVENIPAAREHVINNYFRYRPTQNGPKYKLDEE
jgi:hypothetical protein